MMVEEYNFWRTRKTKFVVRLSGAVFAVLIAIVGVWAWMLYHQKSKESQMDSNRPSDPAAAALESKPDSTNTTASSLAPLPPESNSK